MDENIKELNLWQRLIGVIANPVKTLAVVAEKPKILWPAVVISLFNLVFFLITSPKMQKYMLIVYDKMPKQQLNAQQLAAMKSYMTGSAIYVSGITILLMPWIIWLVYTLLFKFFNLFVGNDAPFKNLYAVSVLSSVPTVLATALRSIMVAFSPAESYASVTTSAAVVLPKGTTGYLFAFLSTIDPFYIWSLVLLAIGGAYVLKTDTKKTGILVFVIWVVMACITTLLAGLNQQQMPGA